MNVMKTGAIVMLMLRVPIRMDRIRVAARQDTVEMEPRVKVSVYPE